MKLPEEESHGGGDPMRLTAMREERKQWAEQQGLSPDLVEKLFEDVVRYFIAEEINHWEASRPG